MDYRDLYEGFIVRSMERIARDYELSLFREIEPRRAESKIMRFVYVKGNTREKVTEIMLDITEIDISFYDAVRKNIEDSLESMKTHVHWYGDPREYW